MSLADIQRQSSEKLVFLVHTVRLTHLAFLSLALPHLLLGSPLINSIFVVITLLIEINYLNKALEIFNTALVVPVYFVLFTTCVLITSFILYQGLKASAVVLITMVLGFLVICLGITLLQMSKVDPSNFKLDRRTTILLQTTRDHPKETASAAESEKGEVLQYEDPGMDALRGGFGAVGSIIRARSVSRRMSRSASMGGRWYDEAYDPKGMQRVGSVAFGGSKEGLNTMGMENLRRYQCESRCEMT
jgi:hypothetical protein